MQPVTNMLEAQSIGRFTLTHLLFQQVQHDTMKELEALKKERSGYQVYVSHNFHVMFTIQHVLSLTCAYYCTGCIEKRG